MKNLIEQSLDLLTDQEIVNKILENNGDVIAYFFIEKTLPFLIKMVHDEKSHISAEELSSELYVHLAKNDWQKLRHFQFRCKLSTWIWTLALHLLCTLTKQTNVSFHSPLFTEKEDQVGVSLLNTKPIYTSDANTMIYTLSNTYYQIIMDLKIIENRSYKEIAMILGRSPAAIRQAHYRAKNELKRTYKIKQQEGL